MIYKVWVIMEELEEEDDAYQGHTERIKIDQFKTEKEAQVLVTGLAAASVLLKAKS